MSIKKVCRDASVDVATWSEQTRENWGLDRTWERFDIDVLEEAATILENRRRSILATIRAKQPWRNT